MMLSRLSTLFFFIVTCSMLSLICHAQNPDKAGRPENAQLIENLTDLVQANAYQAMNEPARQVLLEHVSRNVDWIMLETNDVYTDEWESYTQHWDDNRKFFGEVRLLQTGLRNWFAVERDGTRY